jgi:hypothetical protein
MAAWKKDELNKIAAADELQGGPTFLDGHPYKPR